MLGSEVSDQRQISQLHHAGPLAPQHECMRHDHAPGMS